MQAKNIPETYLSSTPEINRSREKLCRWQCGRRTDRRCGICIHCCDERDRQIASGAPYVPPDKRPGHRFYERKVSEARKAALTRARAAKFSVQMRQAGLLGADASNSAPSED